MESFSSLVLSAFRKEALKKLVFSKSRDPEILKLTARTVSHRGRMILACEYSKSGNTVAQRNLRDEEILSFIDAECERFDQANLITTVGDAERKVTKKGEVILGADKLMRKLTGRDLELTPLAIGKLDAEKNRILSGSEDFLISLGISDKNGRVHDKKQPKFRQINRFLEYVEDVYPSLPEAGSLYVLDLCSGKSYLSFAVYYYLTAIKKREVRMLGIDLKASVIAFCAEKARELKYEGLTFIADDIRNTPRDKRPDLVLSLHACDVATDIVLDCSQELRAGVILSTPCCQRELSQHLDAEFLAFALKYPKIKTAIASALTDALRLERLKALGYEVKATELVDPEDTPKNTLLVAILKKDRDDGLVNNYNALLEKLLGSGAETYIGRI